MQADWIFSGGPILSGHAGWRPAEAVAMAGGRVIAFGSKADVMNTAGPSTRYVDLAGRALVPGLTDAHLHILGYAESLDRLALAGLPSLAAVKEAVAAETGRRPAGQWISGRGWDQDRWTERRLPDRSDLDAVAPNHPVFLQRNCNHLAVVNSAALRLMGITRETPDPAGGKIDRDPVTGEPTGLLREMASDMVRRAIPLIDTARRQMLLQQAMRQALSYGITQVQTDDVERSTGGFDRLEALFGSLVGPEGIGLRITEMIPMDLLEEANARATRTGAGNEWFRYGHVKLFADGSLGGRTAALQEPYSDDASTSGIYIHTQAELNDLISRAHALGNQVGCHAIGDGAARAVLDAVAEAQRRRPRADARHRIIHAQILSSELMDRMRDQQVVADVQPIFIKSDGYWYADRVGAERTRTSYAWKSMLERGIPVCGGSDCPIEPLNIWLNVYTAVNRQDLNGYPAGGWSPEQRLTVAEALDIYTRGASYATFEEQFRGSLAPGLAADAVVLDRNPFACDPSELKDVQVQLTMAGGRVVFER